MSKTMILVACMAAAACHQNTEPRLDNTVLGVRGLVRTTAGSPVPDATVSLTVFRNTCDGTVESTAVTQTDESGRFVALVSGSSAAVPRCVRAEVTKTGLRGTADSPGLAFPTRTPRDTIDMNVTVQ